MSNALGSTQKRVALPLPVPVPVPLPVPVPAPKPEPEPELEPEPEPKPEPKPEPRPEPEPGPEQAAPMGGARAGEEPAHSACRRDQSAEADEEVMECAREWDCRQSAALSIRFALPSSLRGAAVPSPGSAQECGDMGERGVVGEEAENSRLARWAATSIPGKGG